MQEKNHVGIDLGKRLMLVTRIRANETIERIQFKTDYIGRQRLKKWLNKNDTVGIEAGNLSFLLAKEIEAEVNSEVLILNPGDLAIIYKSLKKTDAEDSLKIARLIKRIPKNELPLVRIPDEYEERARFILSEYEFWSKNRTRTINRLHSIIANAGITTVTKKEMGSNKKRKNLVDNINGSIKNAAVRLEEEITKSDKILKELEKEITELLKLKKEKTEIIMSVDGIGKITSLAILGYIGDGKRFSNAGQVSYYAGLVPRVDISGDTVMYGKIIKRGCHQLKRCLIQCAWATIRSKNENALKNKFEELRRRKGKKKAIVAIARKLIELVYTLLVKGEKNKYMPLDILANKLALYKIC